ncbi:hypothetical protein B0H17DRAFT_1148641 [Mycena rosella]|uniref:Uncharacterized protein n=1 Tax=Mycena rosella TaxID=1033263 RepID=A0AAD7C9U0_MYCRO|nr:hypothetical protein B0H17DRAFT_1148641 [Mycena rosella]
MSSPLSFVLVSALTEAVLELSLYGAFAVVFSVVVYLFGHIHRLYVVWSCDRRVIIFPLIILLCQIASGIHVVYDLSRETLFNFYALSNPWVTTNLVSSLLCGTSFSAHISGRRLKRVRNDHPQNLKYFAITPATHRGFRPGGASTESIGDHDRELSVADVRSQFRNDRLASLTPPSLKNDDRLRLISFQIGLLAQSVLQALSPVVFGISVVLIHARVGLGWAKESYTGTTPTGITLNISTVTSRWEEPDLERGKYESRD